LGIGMKLYLKERGDMMVENEETETFECPICQTTVSANATSCSECGAIFEMEKQIPSPTAEEETQAPSRTVEEEQQVPLPSYLNSRAPEPLKTEEKETEPITDLLEEEEIIIEQEDAASPPVEEEPPPPVSEEPEEPAPEGPGPEVTRELPTEQKVTATLLDYTKQRRKRYLSGALFLGIGLVLFVLLWLVVVYETLVTEIGDLFLMEVLLILVGAGIFFVLGLYLILTYPKSSLIDVFGSLTSSEQMDEPTEEY
jgi:hypothetical protein